MSEEPRALLLVGTMGSGKTTVMLELGRLLGERGEPYALVDLDWLAWVEPPPSSALGVHDVLVANLAAAISNFRQAGIERFVLARHLTRADELAGIEAALAGAELAVLRLDAPSALLESRIRTRDTGRELEEHLAELGAAAPPEFPHAVVPNDGRTAAAVAADVLRTVGW
jgi:GTPase SAR1 family protein